jgi:hypothetical protein
MKSPKLTPSASDARLAAPMIGHDLNPLFSRAYGTFLKKGVQKKELTLTTPFAKQVNKVISGFPCHWNFLVESLQL